MRVKVFTNFYLKASRLPFFVVIILYAYYKKEKSPGQRDFWYHFIAARLIYWQLQNDFI